MNKKNNFISQCTASSPCPKDEIRCGLNDDSTCSLCKRTSDEISGWYQKTTEEKYEICKNLLER